jgi:radical SAM superfamily enzyme YgiQ (UPF0313 family)
MKVLLISTYELGRQPLGLATPLATLRAAGHSARGVDLSVEPLDEQAVTEAGLIGISTPMHTALRLGVETARRIRALNPKAHLVFYGLYAWLNADYLLSACADTVIGGEAEEALAMLAAGLSKPGASPSASRQRRLLGLGRPGYQIPDREGLPSLELYARLEDGDRCRTVAAVETSRGCAHTCLHCPITPVYGGRLRIVPRETVVDDVRRVVAMGAEHLTFADPDFFNGVRHSMAIVRAIHAEFPKLTFDATIKVEHLLEHRALLPELRRCGCVFVLSAVEALSDVVLGHLEKGHSAADVSLALALCRESDICLRPSLLPFTPWATLEDYLELLDFVEANELVRQVDAVQFSIRLLVPPGSALLAKMAPFVGPLDAEGFVYPWRHPDRRMDDLAAQVAARVEAAACSQEDAPRTFVAVRALARDAAGLPPLSEPEPRGEANGSRAPRLSEAWFCCAEPTGTQRSLVTVRAV